MGAPSASDAASLLLGPLLPHVGARDATVWVEADRPCLSVAQLTFDGASAVFALEKSAYDGPITRATPVPEARLELTAGQA